MPDLAGNGDLSKCIFWNRSGKNNTLVPACSYAVVGPRPETVIGSQNEGNKGNSTDHPDPPSLQRIVLAGDKVQFTDGTGYDRTSFLVGCKLRVPSLQRPILPTYGALVRKRKPPSLLDLTLRNHCLIPIIMTNRRPASASQLVCPSTLTMTTMTRGRLLSCRVTHLIARTAVRSKKTIFWQLRRHQYRTAFLQRLANPNLPWDAETNPYITVDWIPIDVTVFNGEDPPGTKDPDDRVLGCPLLNRVNVPSQTETFGAPIREGLTPIGQQTAPMTTSATTRFIRLAISTI